MSAVLSKLGVTTRRDAARRAVELGLVGAEQHRGWSVVMSGRPNRFR